MLVSLTEVLRTLLLVVIFAVLIERALAIVFESRMFIIYFHRFGPFPIKEFIVFGVSLTICLQYDLDIMSTLLASEPSFLGKMLTAAILGGFSKGYMGKAWAEKRSLRTGRKYPWSLARSWLNLDRCRS